MIYGEILVSFSIKPSKRNSASTIFIIPLIAKKWLFFVSVGKTYRIRYSIFVSALTTKKEEKNIYIHHHWSRIRKEKFMRNVYARCWAITPSKLRVNISHESYNTLYSTIHLAKFNYTLKNDKESFRVCKIYAPIW